MHILSILFFCIAASSDNFIIGLSYGTKKISINFANNLVVALISCAGTFVAMYFGQVICRFIPNDNHENLLGSLLLILFGIYMFFNSIRKNIKEKQIKVGGNKEKINYYNNVLEHPEIMDTNNSKQIEFKEAFALGLILCLNNIGLGVGASMMGLNIYITSLASLFFSFIFVKTGCYIGQKIFSDRLSKYSEYISAVMIIILGIYEFFI